MFIQLKAVIMFEKHSTEYNDMQKWLREVW